MKVAATLLLAASAVAQISGPGLGPWEKVSPESEGLDSAELESAAAAVSNILGGRNCYLVTKNGKIVYEQYFGSNSETSRHTLYSVTKSLGSTLVGMTAEMHGTDTQQDIRNYVPNPTNRIVPGSTVEHVLTMTAGTSPPGTRYSYDTTGVNGLNDLSEVVSRTSGVRTRDFMERHMKEGLGMDHDLQWSGGNDGSLRFGEGGSASCRDLARVGQLWANQGEWKDVGQVLSSDYVYNGTRKVFPNAGNTDMGYSVRPYDNERAFAYHGMFQQCLVGSSRLDTVIVSLGTNLLAGTCGGVWDLSKGAVGWVSSEEGDDEPTHVEDDPISLADIARAITTADEEGRKELLEAVEQLSDEERMQLAQELLFHQ